MFLFHDFIATSVTSSLYGCGDNSQGQLGIDFPDSFTINSSQTNEPIRLDSSSSGASIQHTPPASIRPEPEINRSSMKQIDYKELISQTDNIDSELKNLLIKTYQPIQVKACWETSFVVLTHSDNLLEYYRANNDYHCEDVGEGSRPTDCFDDHVLAFGSNDFDLRGSIGLLTDPRGANLVNLPELGCSARRGRKIRLHSGCKHVIAMIRFIASRECPPSNQLVGWGAARHGQLGPIDVCSRPPRSIKPTLLSITIPPSLNFSSIKIALGNQHTIIASPSEIWCWGTNRNSQLPQELQILEPSRILELQASWNATFVLVEASRPGFKLLLGYGSNAQGQLGVEDPTASKVERMLVASYSRLSAGSEHVLLTNGDCQLWGWGWNEHGNLAKESAGGLEETRPFGPVFRPPEGQYISNVLAGCATSFAVCRAR